MYMDKVGLGLLLVFSKLERLIREVREGNQYMEPPIKRGGGKGKMVGWLVVLFQEESLQSFGQCFGRRTVGLLFELHYI